MTQIPGTHTKAVFQPVASGVHPHLYYAAGEGNLAIASLNAGNSGALYVGGDGINSGFAHALAAQDTSAYQTNHQALAKATPTGQTATRTYAPADPCASMTICNKRVSGATDYTGRMRWVAPAPPASNVPKCSYQ